MKKLIFVSAIIVFLAYFNSNTVYAQVMILNPDDKECVVRGYDRGLKGNIKTVVVTIDNGAKYYYEFNWKTKEGYKGARVSWERDVMQIAYEACKKGISLESVGFKSYGN